MILAPKLCPESFEPVVYWSLPLFHRIWHPLASGPNPIAGLAGLILNALLISGAAFLILSLRKKM